MIKKYKADKKGAYFADWQTPLSDAESVYLMSILHAPAHTFFFFLTRHGKKENKEKLHSMRITRGYAFRVFDEYCTRPIAEYISSKKENISFRTCKVWNSPFLKEMDSTGELSGIGEKKIMTYSCTSLWLEMSGLNFFLAMTIPSGRHMHIEEEMRIRMNIRNLSKNMSRNILSIDHSQKSNSQSQISGEAPQSNASNELHQLLVA